MIDPVGVATSGAQRLSRWAVHLDDEVLINAGGGHYNWNRIGISKHAPRCSEAMVNDGGYSLHGCGHHPEAH